jgi:D-xylose transport system permease protein
MTDIRPAARQPGEPAATSLAEAQPGAAFPVETLELGPRTPREVVTSYVGKVRGGDPGALPAICALLVLVLIFSAASERFLTIGNAANVTAQSGAFVILGMGLIFVLLLGEIDLSAGTAGGVCAVVMALALTRNGDLQSALGTGTFVVLIVAMLAALAVAVATRLWIAAAAIALGTVLDFTKFGENAAGR